MAASPPVQAAADASPTFRAACFDSNRIWSYGVFNHHSWLAYSLPLMLFQIVLFFCLFFLLRFFLRPLKQPLIVSQVMAGILLGPTLLGRSRAFTDYCFPPRGQIMSDTVAWIGTIFFLFVEGVKQDVRTLTHPGKKEFVIFASGVISSFLVSFFLVVTVGNFVPESIKSSGVLSFVPGAMTVSSFAVLQPILAELNLLNSELGRLAMSLSMISSALGFVVGIANQAIRHSRQGMTDAAGYLLGTVSMIAFLILACRPAMLRLERKMQDDNKLESTVVTVAFVVVLMVALWSQLMGATMFEGPLILAILVPPGPPLGAAVVERLDILVRVMLMPLFFIFNGRKFSLFEGQNWPVWCYFQVLIWGGAIGKFVGTMLAAQYYKMPSQESITLALIMGFKGFTEFLIFTNWMQYKVIDAKIMAALQFAAVMVTATATPLVSLLSKRSIKTRRYYNGRSIQQCSPNSEFRVLTCVHDDDNVPSLLNLLNTCSAARHSPLHLFLLHLVELVGRGAPILIAHKGLSSSPNPPRLERLVRAFRNLVRRSAGAAALGAFTSVSPYKTMHQDVCKLAVDKRVCLILVPIQQQAALDAAHAPPGQRSARLVARNVLYEAPCTVGVIYDKGNPCCRLPLWTARVQFSFRVGIVFLGGADDREALHFVSRMVEKPGVSLLALRCLIPYGVAGGGHERERLLDDEVMGEFRLKTLQHDGVVYREEVVMNVVELMKSIRSMGDAFDLMIVGRRHEAHSMIIDALSDWSEWEELGVIGDFLASPDFGDCSASVLAVQQNGSVNCYRVAPRR